MCWVHYCTGQICTSSNDWHTLDWILDIWKGDSFVISWSLNGSLPYGYWSSAAPASLWYLLVAAVLKRSASQTWSIGSRCSLIIPAWGTRIRATTIFQIIKRTSCHLMPMLLSTWSIFCIVELVELVVNAVNLEWSKHKADQHLWVRRASMAYCTVWQLVVVLVLEWQRLPVLLREFLLQMFLKGNDSSQNTWPTKLRSP